MIARDESALIAEFRTSRDARLFDLLYRSHNPMMYSIAMRLMGDPSAAADAVHDAWVRCIEKLDRFERRSSFRTWATGILVNCIREARRRNQWEQSVDDADIRMADEVALPHAVDPFDLERAIASLPDGFREVLILHDVEGFSHEEIGNMLGIAAGTSKSQLARARRRVRQRLGEGRGVA